MRIQRYQRTQVQPVGAGGALMPGGGTAAAGAATAFATLGRATGAVAEAQAELAERQRASERASQLDRLTLDYKLAFALWADERTRDPSAYKTLESDSVTTQRKLRDQVMQSALGDQELQSALVLRLDEFDGMRSIELRRAANDQMLSVARGTLEANLNDSAALYARANEVERTQILRGSLDAIGMQVQAGALTAEQGVKAAQAWTDNAYGNDIARRVVVEPDQVLADIREGRYHGASDDVLLRGEQSAQDEIERRAAEAERERARAEAAAQAHLAQAQRAIDRVGRILDTGLAVDPGTLAIARDLAAGTEAEVELSAMLSGYADRSRFAAQSLPAQAAEIEVIQQRALTEGVDEEGARDVVARQRMFEAATKAAKDDPLIAARDRGIIPSFPPIDTRSPEALAESLRARSALAEQASTWAGRPVPPLTKDEATGLGKLLDQGGADDRLRVLDGMASAIDNPAAFRATMQQLAPGHSVLATAGNFLQAGEAQVADMMVQGELLVNPPTASGAKPMTLPKDAELRAEFEAATEGVFQGNQADRDRLYQASRAVYATLSQKAGSFTDEIDTRRWQQAIDLASGGVVDLDGWLGDGRRVIKPLDMTAEAFRAAVRDVGPDQVARLGGVAAYSDEDAAEAIRDGALQNFGDGYVIRDGEQLLQRRDGRGVFVWRPDAGTQPAPRRGPGGGAL